MGSSLLISQFGDWSLSAYTIIDLIAASTNAFNGAMLARQPDHFRHWTVVGIILLGVAGGIGGGVVRDVILNTIPSALTNPLYLICSLLMADLAIVLTANMVLRVREGIFQFMTAFALPWYAVVGTQKALSAHLPYLPAVLIGVLGATAGRYFIDITAGVPPKHFVKGEWFVGTAVLASVLYLICEKLGLALWPAALITVAIACGFRLMARCFSWEESELQTPKRAQP